MADEITTPHAIWLFDSACVLCSGAVQYVLKHERKAEIRFIAIQSHAGRVLAAAHGVDSINPETFLFLESGVALKGSDGVLAMLKYLRGPAVLLNVARLLPHSWRDAAYFWLARNRYRLFGRRNCLVPSAELRHRFVLPEA